MKKNTLKPIKLKTKRFYMAISYVYETLKLIIGRNQSNSIGGQTKGYTLIKNLNLGLSQFEVGIYENKSGKLIVGKIWKGNIKDLNYFALYQEIILYQVLAKVIRRVNRLIPSHLQEISIPNYFGFMKVNNKLGLFTEFVKGSALTNSNPYKQYNYMQKCIEYLGFLGSHLTPLEKSLISQGNILDKLLVYPLFLVVALIKRPQLAKYLLKGFLIVIKSTPAILKHEENTLIHGDLHPRNIIISNKQVKILDLEQTTFSYPMYEYIYSILCLSVNTKLSNLLLKDINSKCNKDESFALCFLALAIKCSTHFLAGNLSKQKLKLCTKVLKISLKLMENKNNFSSGRISFAV